jgi:C4-dicarboxylate-specific signal transduction histidine kinase
LHAVVIVVLALGAAGLAIARVVDVDRVERRASEERAALARNATEALTARTAALLRLSALPLGWAVRGALLKDDFNSVDAYLQKIVQEPQVTAAALVGTDGKVRLASNRKLENHPVDEAFPGVRIDQQNPTTTSTDSDVRVIVPIMGYDRRLGTLILSYQR